MLEPHAFDVKCGKEKTYHKHPGNIAFARTIAKYSAKYSCAQKRRHRMSITTEILCSMKSRFGSRFLKRTKSGGWREISDLVARDKISHALRHVVHKQEMDSSSSSESEGRDEIFSCIPEDDDETFRLQAEQQLCCESSLFSSGSFRRLLEDTSMNPTAFDPWEEYMRLE